MAEPIPTARDADDETTLPSNAEDRKAAAALSSLNENDITQEDSASGSGGTGTGSKGGPSHADQEALGKAMSRLESIAGPGAQSKKEEEAKSTTAVEKKKAVKVASEDVNLLVSGGSIEKAVWCGADVGIG